MASASTTRPSRSSSSACQEPGAVPSSAAGSAGGRANDWPRRAITVARSMPITSAAGGRPGNSLARVSFASSTRPAPSLSNAPPGKLATRARRRVSDSRSAWARSSASVISRENATRPATSGMSVMSAKTDSSHRHWPAPLRMR